MRPLTHQSYFIELTNHCNMHCSFCPSDELGKQRRNSSDDTVERFIRQIAEIDASACLIHFNVLGEPLLNKRAFEYVKLCHDLGLRCCVITNLTLLTQSNIEQLLAFNNLLLVLSVQTPTEESFRIRGYKHIDFDAYMATIERVILTKFKMKSEAWIEVHIAGSHNPPNLLRESGKPLWSIYADAFEQKAVVDEMIERCLAISSNAQAMYGDFYASAIRPDYVSEDARPLRDNPNVSEQEFWGWMFAPNVFLRVKEFGLWGLQEKFLNKFLATTEKVFVEEAAGSFACPMAQRSLAMLADGQFTACCLDYDGEIDFGNINERTARQAFWSIDRSKLLADASSQPSCRRCQGKAFIFDTSPINAAKYQVTMFGHGWHDYEPGLCHRGGRWTDGAGTFYLYGRSFIATLTLELFSAFPTGTELKLVIDKFNDGTRQFDPIRELLISVDPEKVARITVPANLRDGFLYRMRLVSPSFVPRDVRDSQDTRRLGLAVFGIEACFVMSETRSGELVDNGHPIPPPPEKPRLKLPVTARTARSESAIIQGVG